MITGIHLIFKYNCIIHDLITCMVKYICNHRYLKMNLMNKFKYNFVLLHLNIIDFKRNCLKNEHGKLNHIVSS